MSEERFAVCPDEGLIVGEECEGCEDCEACEELYFAWQTRQESCNKKQYCDAWNVRVAVGGKVEEVALGEIEKRRGEGDDEESKSEEDERCSSHR